jgi:hypothetical protein
MRSRSLKSAGIRTQPRRLDPRAPMLFYLRLCLVEAATTAVNSEAFRLAANVERP